MSKLRTEKMSVCTKQAVCSMNDSPVRGKRAPGIATAK